MGIKTAQQASPPNLLFIAFDVQKPRAYPCHSPALQPQQWKADMSAKGKVGNTNSPKLCKISRGHLSARCSQSMLASGRGTPLLFPCLTCPGPGWALPPSGALLDLRISLLSLVPSTGSDLQSTHVALSWSARMSGPSRVCNSSEHSSGAVTHPESLSSFTPPASGSVLGN